VLGNVVLLAEGSLIRIARRLESTIQKHGPIGTLRLVPRLALSKARDAVRRITGETRRREERARRFDASMGIDTCDDVELADLDVPASGHGLGVKYQASPPELFHQLLARTAIDPTDYHFVDIGSGKGRVLCLAALYPFKSVTGVEFSRELSAIADRNIEGFRHPGRKCELVRSVCADATAFELPDGPTLVYLFNPFRGAIMTRFVAGLERSLAERPRDLFVVYFNCQERRVFDRSPALREVAAEAAERASDDPWVIYRSVVSSKST
jgi:SAM-dependent methyltransferase